MNDFLKLTLTETIALIKNRKVSVKEIIETYIKRLNETKKFGPLEIKILKCGKVRVNNITTP